MWNGPSAPQQVPGELPGPQAAALFEIIARGPHTRPELTTATGLSSPTVIHAVDALEAQRFVQVVESRQGARGRAAQVYALGNQAGWSLGLDLGTSHLEFVALDLSGEQLGTRRLAHLAETESRTPVLDDAARTELGDFAERISRQAGPLRAAGVAVSTIVPPEQRRYSERMGMESLPGVPEELTPSFDLARLVRSLGLAESLPIVLENNINCSALSEAHRPDRESSDLLYLHLGTGGVGIGIVSGGELVRGHHGAAGEMRWFPYPHVPHAVSDEAPFTLERHLGAAGLRGRAAAVFPRESGEDALGAAELIMLAEKGDPDASGILDSYAFDVALALVAFISVLDPESVVLGGGVGNNPILLELVGEHLRRLGRPVPLSGDLGETSSALGAGILALYESQRILGLSTLRFRHPL